MKNTLLFVVAVSLLPSCGSNVAGDWFRCEDVQCTILSPEGIRMVGDGTLSALFAESGDPTAGYCYRPWSGVWDNEEDVYFFSWVNGNERESQIAVLQFDGDTVVVITGNNSTRWKAVGPLEYRECASDPGGPPPAFGPADGG